MRGVLSGVLIAVTLTACGAGTGGSGPRTASADAPSARAGAAMAYDPSTHQVVLFGGGDRVSLDETWLWDGTAWKDAGAASHPRARENATMAFDRRSSRLILFGGDSLSSSDGVAHFLQDTWAWDGSAWSELHPKTVPTAAGTPHMSTAGSDGLILVTQFGYGANAGDPSRTDTWLWDGADWHHGSPRDVPTGDGPGSTQGPPAQGQDRPTFSLSSNFQPATGLAFDPVTQRPLLMQQRRYGQTSVGSAATWTWDGQNWTLLHPQASPPGPISYPLLGGDGGDASTLLALSDGTLWSWNGNTWAKDSRAGPGVRGNAALAFDGDHGELLLFGGIAETPGGLYADTWTWSKTAGWRRAAGPAAPEAIQQPSLTIPPNGVSLAQAITAARQFMGLHGDPIATRSGPLRDFALPGETVTSDRYVWAVVFGGTFASSCGGAPPPGQTRTCPPPATTIAVFVDYVTGTALSATSPAPSQLLAP